MASVTSPSRASISVLRSCSSSLAEAQRLFLLRLGELGGLKLGIALPGLIADDHQIVGQLAFLELKGLDLLPQAGFLHLVLVDLLRFRHDPQVFLVQGSSEIFNRRFHILDVGEELFLVVFKRAELLPKFGGAAGQVADFPLAVEGSGPDLLFASAGDHPGGMEDLPFQGDQSFPDGIPIPKIDGVAQIGNDPHVPEKVLGQRSEILLDFHDLQQGDHPLRRGAEPLRAGWGFKWRGMKLERPERWDFR